MSEVLLPESTETTPSRFVTVVSKTEIAEVFAVMFATFPVTVVFVVLRVFDKLVIDAELEPILESSSETHAVLVQ